MSQKLVFYSAKSEVFWGNLVLSLLVYSSNNMFFNIILIAIILWQIMFNIRKFRIEDDGILVRYPVLFKEFKIKYEDISKLYLVGFMLVGGEPRVSIYPKKRIFIFRCHTFVWKKNSMFKQFMRKVFESGARMKIQSQSNMVDKLIKEVKEEMKKERGTR